MKCDFCGKASSSAGDLRKHINAVHYGIKDHKFDFCEKSYSQAEHMKTYINSVHKS